MYIMLLTRLSNSSNITTKLSRDFYSKEGPRPLTTTFTTIVDSRNGDKATSKSTYGYLYKLAGRPISWKTKRATTIALSTLEAETNGLIEAIREVQWIIGLFSELYRPIDYPITLYRDNQGSITVANDLALHARTKHTLLKFRYVREQVKAKIVTIIYLNTKSPTPAKPAKITPAIRYIAAYKAKQYELAKACATAGRAAAAKRRKKRKEAAANARARKLAKKEGPRHSKRTAGSNAGRYTTNSSLTANKDNNNAYNRAYVPPTNIEKEKEKGSSSDNNSVNGSTSDSTDKGEDSSTYKYSKSALCRKARPIIAYYLEVLIAFKPASAAAGSQLQRQLSYLSTAQHKHSMEPDLSRSISMHPHVFQTQSGNSFASTSPRSGTPAQPAPHASPSPKHHGPNATSTAVEAMTPEDDNAVSRHPSTAATDVEIESQRAGGRLPLGLVGQDPYGLTTRYKSASEIEAIKANTSRKRIVRASASGSGPSASVAAYGLGTGKRGKLAACLPEFGRSAVQAKRVETFYHTQNETIERLLKSVEEHRAEARQEQGEEQLKYKIAVWGSLLANVVLAALQVYGAISSGSLSLFTTMADAIFDPLSNVTLILTNRAVKSVDPSRFPSGKARLETVGNIVFCFLMTAVSFILIAFSIHTLSTRAGSDELNAFHFPSVIAVVVAFTTKLVLFLYTWSIKDNYSQVNILWQDHRNDLLINGFGILTSVGGSKLVWWIDPAGAIVLSVIVSMIWLRTAFLEFMLLVGVVASVQMQQLITYVCLTHAPSIRQIDTVRVYHSGPRLIAEVDIVMSPDESLMATHDVAEDLQIKLESLPDVERAEQCLL
ncbi:hypothetical protein P8C59_005275 [Phyllachora maydis]|uniref:Cation efflux protein transmembrane domain-containing protein n=1 Tax=Phyllachora maydis TaxID=1825666 RepID=A0AAD9I444_9PEZI|nr:hypothetical protein P8C59_005275 [Phyllachora maydis]